VPVPMNKQKHCSCEHPDHHAYSSRVIGLTPLLSSQRLHVFCHILSWPSELNFAVLHVAGRVSPLQLFQSVRDLEEAMKQCGVCMMVCDCTTIWFYLCIAASNAQCCKLHERPISLGGGSVRQMLCGLSCACIRMLTISQQLRKLCLRSL